ncbi:MAG TPA: 5-carboxymethyl-2-hydroxymuconate Delta-isomerase [Thermoanaerobaculia bacterium]
MPHCILEYSSNIVSPPDVREVLLDIHRALVGTGLFAEADIKSRAIRHEVFAVADGAADRSFVALAVEILDGRTDQVKAQVADALFAVLAAGFARAIEASRCNVTVQIRDIHRASYRRHRGDAG